MAFSFAARADRTEVLKKEYAEKLSAMDLRNLVLEFLSYLDYKEESDSGVEFHPITISSCRVLMTQPLGMCLKALRGAARHEFHEGNCLTCWSERRGL